MNRRQIANPAVALLRHLAAASRRGLPLNEIGQLLEAECQKVPGVDSAPLGIAPALARGAPLSAALQQAQPPYAEPVVHWLQQAEAAGQPADAIEALADDLEAQQGASHALRLLLLWPAAIATTIVMVMAIMGVYVIPAFDTMYADLGGHESLPAITYRLVGASRWMSAHWWAWGPLLMLLIGLGFAGRLPVRLVDAFYRLTSPLPFVKRLHHARWAVRFVRLCRAHHASTTVLAAALGHLAATTRTPVLARATGQVQAGLLAGRSLGDALPAVPAVPPRITLYTRLGERLGDPAASLAQMHDLATQDLHAAQVHFERASFVLLYYLLGLAVFIALLGVYLPIFKIGAIV